MLREVQPATAAEFKFAGLNETVDAEWTDKLVQDEYPNKMSRYYHVMAKYKAAKSLDTRIDIDSQINTLQKEL